MVCLDKVFLFAGIVMACVRTRARGPSRMRQETVVVMSPLLWVLMRQPLRALTIDLKPMPSSRAEIEKLMEQPSLGSSCDAPCWEISQ